MNKSSWIRDFVVGLIFLGSLLIVGSATLWLQGLPWSSAQALEVRFPSVDNLKRGEPVLLKGVPVGQVQSIAYSPDPTGGPNNVRVTVSLEKEIIGALKNDAEFYVRSAGPLGGRQLEIEPGGGSAVRAEALPVFGGEADGDIFRELADFVRENREPFRELIAGLRRNSDNIEVLTQDIVNQRGFLGKLIRDDTFSNNANSFVERIESIAASIQEGEGLASYLINDVELKNNIKSLIDAIEQQEGVLGMLLHDEAAKTDLREFITNVKDVTTEIRSGEGLLAKLMNDPELAADAKTAFHSLGQVSTDLGDVVERVKNGDGTVGKLINDETTYNEILRLLVLARETLEDLREQAPISTFTNVIFSAF